MRAATVEELESFSICLEDANKSLKIGKKLHKLIKCLLKNFLAVKLEVFTWKHVNMKGIDSKVACHALKLDPNVKLKMKRCLPMSIEKYEALKARKISY